MKVISLSLTVGLSLFFFFTSCSMEDISSTTMPQKAILDSDSLLYAAGDCAWCDWYGTVYPICCNQSSGWGWEWEQSCISLSECQNGGTVIDDGGSGGSSAGDCGWADNGYPYCCSSDADPDGDGWGWEWEQSCVMPDGGGGGDGGSSGSCPSSLTCPGSASCGCYTVSGLGSNKQALTSAGGSQYMMAAAMMETERMDTNYAWCDGKSGDSCCCGVTKMNWFAARTAGANYSDYSSFCNAVNSNRGTDVSIWNSIRSYFGSLYWAVHRNGETGYYNPNTDDIQRFKDANDWTNNHIGSHTTDDVRFWVDVPAI